MYSHRYVILPSHMILLNIITTAHLLVFFSLLFFRKENALPNKVLALLLINPAINFISNVNTLSGNLPDAPYVYFFAQATAGLFAPLVYMYAILMIGRPFTLRKPIYLLTLAHLLTTAFFTFEFAVMLSPSAQQAYLTGILKGPYPEQMNIVNGIFILSQQIYFTIAAVNIYQHKKQIVKTLSSFEKTKLTYITRFISLIWLLNLIALVTYITLPTILVEYIVLPSVLTTICFFILYFSFRHNSIFTPETYRTFLSDITTAGNGMSKGEPPAQAEVTGNTELEQIVRIIQDNLYEQEPFINPDLTLSAWAATLRLPESKISLAINKMLKKNFYDLINEARVKKAQTLLQLRQELSIEGVAHEAGFNSRASFYRAFKKYTGMTPSAFLKTLETPGIK
jgi:AraC-like DNA-binding protein